MVRLKEILREEVLKYAGSGRGINLRLFPLLDDEHQTYGVAAVDYPTREAPSDLVVFARLEQDTIIIEEDLTDKKLVDALLQRHIPREKIILAYEGEEAAI